MKPGVRTSEFWIVIGGLLAAVAIAGGWATHDDVQQAMPLLGDGGQAALQIADVLVRVIAGVAGAVALAWKYLQSRHALKVKEIEQGE